MNDTIWYYVDRAQQRHGPVSGSAVADAWRAGEADDGSLVWHEGLPEWLPLARFHDELGLVGAPSPAAEPVATTAPSPGRPAGAATTAAPAKSGNGCLIAAIIVGLLLVMVVAILAAIALPAYQQYLDRAREAATEIEPDETDAGIEPVTAPGSPEIVAAALAEARQYQTLVDDFVANTDRCPRDPGEVALPRAMSRGVVAIAVGEARTGMCTIEVEFGGDGAETLSGERLTLSRDVAGDWYCTSAMAGRDNLPADCR